MSDTTNTFGPGGGGHAVVVEAPARSSRNAANLWIHLAGTIHLDSAQGYSADVTRLPFWLDLSGMLRPNDQVLETAIVLGLAGGFRNETSLFNTDDWLIAVDGINQTFPLAAFQIAWKSDAWPHRLFVVADVLAVRPALEASKLLEPRRVPVHVRLPREIA